MVDDFGRRAQRDADHTHNVQHPTDNEPADLFSLLNDAARVAAGQDDDSDQALTTAEKFERYHEQNPNVYKAMVVLCRQWINRTGRRKLGINSLVERVRWEIAISINDPEFRINNSFAPYYARLIMRQEVDLADLFELRRSAADEWIAGQIGRAA